MEAKPFIKWVGGKRALLPTIRSLAPPKYGRYIDPFVGGGAVFFDANPRRFIVGDVSQDLIDCYLAIRDKRLSVVKRLDLMENSKEEFHRLREQDAKRLNPAYRAARFIYLNKTAHRGMYEVNKDGQFASSYGYMSGALFNRQNLRAVQVLLQRGDTRCADYAELLLAEARKGDWCFLDPPYLLPEGKQSWRVYTAHHFGQYQHAKLASVVRDLDRRGCLVMVCNSHHPLVKKLYHGFEIREVTSVRRFHGRAWRTASEFIVRNYG